MKIIWGNWDCYQQVRQMAQRSAEGVIDPFWDAEWCVKNLIFVTYSPLFYSYTHWTGATSELPPKDILEN